MAHIIAIANQKGGVGKTTTAVNLAASVAAAEKRVLLIDLDPQGNASSGLGLDKGIYRDQNIYHVLIDELPIQEALYPTDLKFLKVCPADNNLSGAEIELVQAIAREMRLKNALDNLLSGGELDFDYVFIDCPPSLGLLTLNSLTAADYFLIPLQCEYYAIEGLGQFLRTAELIKKGLNKDLKQLGILLTMYDSRNKLCREVVGDVKGHFKGQVFETIIPRNVKLSESPSHGKPVLLYDINSAGSQSYLNLAQELFLRLDAPKITTATVTEKIAQEIPEEISVPAEAMIEQQTPNEMERGIEHGDA